MRGPHDRLLEAGCDLWQEDRERAPQGDRALNLDRAAGLSDEAVHGREAEPSSLAKVLRGEERIEQAGKRCLVHPGARIRDSNPDGGLERLAAPECLLGTTFDIVHRDREGPAIVHRILGVHGEIDQDLVERDRIDPDPELARLDVQGDIDVF